MKKIIAAILSLIFVLLAASACTDVKAPGKIIPETKPRESETQPKETEPVRAEIKGIVNPADYRGIFDIIKKNNSSYYRYGEYWVLDEAEQEAPTSAAETNAATKDMSTGADGDYSKTNTQIDGIDEGDIVKTDGRYIYKIRKNSELIIMSADGENTETISVTKITEDGREEYDEIGEKYSYYQLSDYAREMYVYGDRLTIVRSHSEYSSNYDDYYYRSYKSNEITVVDVYDISDPRSPSLISSEGQDGYYNTSRMTEGQLYLITSYYPRYYISDDTVYSEIVCESYIPHVYSQGNKILLPADDIVCFDDSDASYTVISSYAMDTGVREDTEAVMNYVSTVYMSSNYVYLASGKSVNKESEEYRQSIYKVKDYTMTTNTQITKISFRDGIFVEYTGEVDGSLLNQFSMDEYGDCLRVVTTVDRYSYTEYVDEENEFINTKDYKSERYNSLYILDNEMIICGAIENIAENERAYSVRFDGDVGYFVTFRQTDPLFAADLSDPADPKIMSELKIPGFSNYMHVYSDGLLFGLGYDADEETGRTEGMKLSMFDVSDPYDVWEKSKLNIGIDYSEASYNHKAILISAEKNLIGFPSERGYLIYGYSDDEGFYKINELVINDWSWNSDSRGVYVGDCFYIVTEDFTEVLDLDTFELVAKVTY